MQNILYYLTQPYAMLTVVAPWLFVIYWYFAEGRKSQPSINVLWHWMLLVIVTYNLTVWRIDDEFIALHMVDAFFIYLAIYLYLRLKISAGAAYVLTFLNEWVVDMTRAYELIDKGLASINTYYWGVGGAGIYDGLCIFPLVSAALVHYATWRINSRKVN